ncbi:MAG: chaperonin [Firmicutes bacterium]|jgi:chaperonin GroEL (HSP60 family)|nr:chaperonin [Bacillota bacterium]
MANSAPNREMDERSGALANNAAAIRAVAAAVEGTIGPKGLDTMLVDRYGDVLITNAGVTILEKMDVTHPAAQLLINVAKAQQEEIGDGTTTATIMANALISAGAEHVYRGVPVARIIDGMRFGLQEARSYITQSSQAMLTLDEKILKQIALVAGREHEDIADLTVQAALLVGKEKLEEEDFKLSQLILAKEGAENEVFAGIILEKEPLNKDMPEKVEKARILLIDDALEPEEIDDEALTTESGFARYMELQNEFKQMLERILQLEVDLILTDKNLHPLAEEVLTDAGIMVVTRVLRRSLRQIAEHSGAKPIKRNALKRELTELKGLLGQADSVIHDKKLGYLRILGGQGQKTATILVGASTSAVVGERERIARDAASAVQAAVKGGVVSGGGAVEIATARHIAPLRDQLKGMSAYGLDIVVEALKRPLAQIIHNAGYNPLEKIEEVLAAQSEEKNENLTIDCDSGEVKDLSLQGILDPTLVKLHALKAAGEVAEAILRIDTIIKKKDQSPEY